MLLVEMFVFFIVIDVVIGTCIAQTLGYFCTLQRSFGCEQKASLSSDKRFNPQNELPPPKKSNIYVLEVLWKIFA